MSTDTPRTTERLHLLENEHDDVAFESLAYFARQLEREATEAHRHEEALRARVAELEKTILRVWESLGITTYEQAKPLTIWEHIDSLRSALAQAEADTKRLDWLIQEGPPGAATGMGFNQTAWDLAYCQPEGMDQQVMRAAIDAALAAQKGQP